MKLNIRVSSKTPLVIPSIIDKGDWIDLRTAETVSFKAPTVITAADGTSSVTFDFKILSLGVAMQLPKGFEAIVAPRSSTFKKLGLLEANSIGVIDNSYCGDNDIWGFPALAMREVTIPKGTRICQFRVQPNQKATILQKLKWLLSGGIAMQEVSTLNNQDRKGFGEGTKNID